MKLNRLSLPISFLLRPFLMDANCIFNAKIEGMGNRNPHQDEHFWTNEIRKTDNVNSKVNLALENRYLHLYGNKDSYIQPYYVKKVLFFNMLF